jgi:antitoxin VapB
MATLEHPMTWQTARVGKNNRAQVVTIPLAFRFPEGIRDVYIRKDGMDVILSPRLADWTLFIESKVCASSDFMEGVEDMPIQERSFT